MQDWFDLAGTQYFLCHSTDFQQQVTSLQINHQPVPEAWTGQIVALKVRSRVHVHDTVYRITAEEAKELEAEQTPEYFW